MSERGRPPGRMTLRRRQAYEAITEAAANGEMIKPSHLARKIGVYSYRDAKRIVGDLIKMGALN